MLVLLFCFVLQVHKYIYISVHKDKDSSWKTSGQVGDVHLDRCQRSELATVQVQRSSGAAAVTGQDRTDQV